MRRASYHTTLKDLIRTGAEEALPDGMFQRIPRSNRHRWRHEPANKYQGAALGRLTTEQLDLLRLTARHERLRRLCMAYARLHLLLRGFREGAWRIGTMPQRSALLAAIRSGAERLPLRRVLRFLGLPLRTYRSWRARTAPACGPSPLDRCRRRHSGQLLPAERDALRTVLQDPGKAHWPVSSLAHWAAREGLVHAARSTWYRYRQALGLPSRRVPRKKRHPPGPRATRPDALWHVDVTPFRTTDGQRWAIHVLVDNYSRRKLAWAVHERPRAAHVVALLQLAWARSVRSDGLPVEVLSDGGSENTGRPVHRLVARLHPGLQHRVALRDLPWSNSMVEAVHKRLKYGFLLSDPPADGAVLRRRVDAAFHEENAVRPLEALNGLTPDEAYFGWPMRTPHHAPGHAAERAAARALRRSTNPGLACGACDDKPELPAQPPG
ncbi:MAG: DDE-type integrase/transposase/recombinase [Flavobacteriales bacterium]|nr:DDE-type integrase/transposase/recombinase [Flavobacteriales bacterium]MBK9274159.1 DDE-type integrase/transposase/recombinase [Flavobacteriales bacterium]